MLSSPLLLSSWIDRVFFGTHTPVSSHVKPLIYHPLSWLHPCIVHVPSHSPLRSDMKPDDLLLKGSRTREKSRDKKGFKDKKKGQAADGSERRPCKAKVDELLVRRLCPDLTQQARDSTRARTNTLGVRWFAGFQQRAGEWVRQLWRLVAHFQPVQRKSRGWRRARTGRRQDRRQIQGDSITDWQKYPKQLTKMKCI